jgi:hypothetical protein
MLFFWVIWYQKLTLLRPGRQTFKENKVINISLLSNAHWGVSGICLMLVDETRTAPILSIGFISHAAKTMFVCHLPC